MASAAATARVAGGFSSLAHSLSHLLMLLYPTAVLAIGPAWGRSYAELLPLAAAGQVLFGLCALPAGWLGDRWSASGMMVVFFLGCGAAAVLTGLAGSELTLACGLALIGLFASIYHPVGIAWLIRNSVNRGKALGINGVFGSIGIGSAALVAGGLSDLISWRAAFIIPGLASLAAGAGLWLAIRRGLIQDAVRDLKPEPPAKRGDVLRAFWVLSVTMFCSGMISQTTTIVLPKLFADHPVAFIGGSSTGVGLQVGVMFVFTAIAGLVGGHLADRVPMKGLYVVTYLMQIPLLMLVAGQAGLTLMGVLIGAMVLQVSGTPAENGLVARYTPPAWRATAYGAKFVLALGASALGYPLVAWLYDGGGSGALYLSLAALALIGGGIALLLPRDPAAGVPHAVPAAGGAD